jgi:hypothetical protein
VNGHSDAAWQQGGSMSGTSSFRTVDCRNAILSARDTGHAGRGRPTMNELISMLPWAFGLVAAAAALTQFR